MSAKQGVFVIFLLWAMMGDTYAQLLQVPEKSGFSGFINIGAAGVRAKSNLIAGNSVADIGNETIPSIFAKPESKSDGIPIINFEVAYTWGPKRTQVFLGNLLEDFLRFDFTSQLGVRHQFRDSSVIAVSFTSSSLPAEVWADPYVKDQKRQKTDRTAKGGRITFSRIGGSGLQLQYTQRKVEIDDELSGLTQLGLPAQQAALLNREGDLKRLEAAYFFKFGERHRLVPALWFTQADLDGGATAYDLVEVQISYLYNGPRFNFVTNFSVGTAEYDEVNPIYGRKQDDDRRGVSFAVFDKKLFGANAKWFGVLTVAAFKEDSDIDFYDSDIALLSLSALRRF